VKGVLKRLGAFCVIFVGAYVACAVAITIGLPKLQSWHFANCLSTSLACYVSAVFLSSWWLVLFPILAVVTLLLTQLLARRGAV
jgi:hypothetical protein